MRTLVLLVFFFAMVMALTLAGCAGSSSNGGSGNAAIDTVKYVESGANCEAIFTQPSYQSARCTLPDGSKIHVATGPDIKDSKGNTVGWASTMIGGAKNPTPGERTAQPAPQPPIAAPPPSPGIKPVPTASPIPAPATAAPKK